MGSKDKEILLKIMSHIQKAMQYMEKYHLLEEFEADSMCVEATVFNLMQIGELVKTSFADETKQRIKSIPWN